MQTMNQNQTPSFQDAPFAFDQAIADGRLSADRNAPNYAGRYMYMGTTNGKDAFKNINTRQYLA